MAAPQKLECGSAHSPDWSPPVVFSPVESQNCALGYVWLPQAEFYTGTPSALMKNQASIRAGLGFGVTARQETPVSFSARREGHLQLGERLYDIPDHAIAGSPEILHVHAGSAEWDTIVQAVEQAGPKVLLAETMGVRPEALFPARHASVFRGADPTRTYLRLLVDNATEKHPWELQQHVHKVLPDTTFMSWTNVHSGAVNYQLPSREDEGALFFWPELSALPSQEFICHTRFPTTNPKAGVAQLQPRVLGTRTGEKVSMHNGDHVNWSVLFQALQQPYSTVRQQQFFQRWGNQRGESQGKAVFPHIDPVDSASVVLIHEWLYDLCKNNGIDPIAISYIERPPMLEEIERMPQTERAFYLDLVTTFPLAYQGSAGTIVEVTDGNTRYVRVTPDTSRTLWVGKTADGVIVAASNGGSIMNALPPDRFAGEGAIFPYPVRSSQIVDIYPDKGTIVNRSHHPYIPPEKIDTGKNGHDGYKPVYFPGIGFEPQSTSKLRPVQPPAPIRQFEKERKSIREMPGEYGLYGYHPTHIDRLLRAGDTGQIMHVGLGHPGNEAVFLPEPEVGHYSSWFKAFISSPGQDPRRSLSTAIPFPIGEEIRVLKTPLLVNSSVLGKDPAMHEWLREAAQDAGTLSIQELPNTHTIRAAYSVNETMEQALERMQDEARKIAQSGGGIVIVDDTVGPGELPISPVLSVGAVHTALTHSEPVRQQGSLVDARSMVQLVVSGNGLTTPELGLECILHGADALSMPLATDMAIGLTEVMTGKKSLADMDKQEMRHRLTNAMRAFTTDIAMLQGAMGAHSLPGIRGNAPAALFYKGINEHVRNRYLNGAPGMDGNGLRELDMYTRMRAQTVYGEDGTAKIMGGKKGLHETSLLWQTQADERWGETPLLAIDTMAETRPDHFRYSEELFMDKDKPHVLEHVLRIAGLEEFKDIYTDEHLRQVDTRMLDHSFLSIAHMSTGARNMETQATYMTAVWNIYLKSRRGEIGFVKPEEARLLVGIGEGGLSSVFHAYIAFLQEQVASGHFDNTGDWGSRGGNGHPNQWREGLERTHLIQKLEDTQDDPAARHVAFNEHEVKRVETLIAELLKKEDIEEVLLHMEEHDFALFSRFVFNTCVKFAQDAKAGMGGMMTKTVLAIAEIRGFSPFDPAKSFFNFPEGDSIEELRQRIFHLVYEAGGDIPELHQGAKNGLITSKTANTLNLLSTALGAIRAGTGTLTIDCAGATGNRPESTGSTVHAWLPIARALQQALADERVGNMVYTKGSSVKTPYEGLVLMILGRLDGIDIGQSVMRAEQCAASGCRHCHVANKAAGMNDPAQLCTQTDQAPLYRLQPKDASLDLDMHSADARAVRVENFLLNYIRSTKAMMHQLGARSIADLHRPEMLARLTPRTDVQVRQSERLDALLDSSWCGPYGADAINETKQVGRRLQVPVEYLLHPVEMDGEHVIEEYRQWLQTVTEKEQSDIPSDHRSRQFFIFISDVFNTLPYLDGHHRKNMLEMAREASTHMEEQYQGFFGNDIESPSDMTTPGILSRYHDLQQECAERTEDSGLYRRIRPKLEYMERIVAGRTMIQLLEEFTESDDRGALKDGFFTNIRIDGAGGMRTPQAIVSEQQGYKVDIHQGVQRDFARHLVQLVAHHKVGDPPDDVYFETDEVLTDMDMGIGAGITAIYNDNPAAFDQAVGERIHMVCTRGIAGHNNGAMLNGRFLEREIVVHLPHADGSVGAMANGATIEVSGNVSDCFGQQSRDLKAAVLKAGQKLGMGARGDSVFYSHCSLDHDAGIAASGNTMIITAAADRHPMLPPAPRGTGAEMVGLAGIVMPGSADTIQALGIPGDGTRAKRLSPLDIALVQETINQHWPKYAQHTPHTPQPTVDGDWSKIVSEDYYRNAITATLVHGFINQLRKGVELSDYLSSLASEIVEYVGLPLEGKESLNYQHAALNLLQQLKEEYDTHPTVQKSLNRIYPEWPDKDTAFLFARSQATSVLKDKEALRQRLSNG